MADHSHPSRPGSARPKPLLSQSSMLVLCGFIVGAVSSDVVGPDFALRVKISGLMGLVGFYAITYAAEWRRRWIARLAVERATHRLENRMQKHIPKPAFQRIASPTFRRAKFGPQYLPVARARSFDDRTQARA